MFFNLLKFRSDHVKWYYLITRFQGGRAIYLKITSISAAQAVYSPLVSFPHLLLILNLKESGMNALKMAAITAFAIAFSFFAAPATSADSIDAEADKILQSMTKYLGSLPSLSVRADIDNEYIDLMSQKLQLSSSAKLIISRPSKLYVTRQGPFAETELIFDGKLISLLARDHNLFVQFENPGTLDKAFETIQERFEFDTPAADLFYADPYPGLMDGVMSSAYYGTAYVDGIECHHLAFRQDKVDWQLWIQVGETPLPMKYVITTKWLTGAPQYAVRLRNWNLKPRIENSQFVFSVPKGAKKTEKITINEMGEIKLEGSQ
jgi:hypothetical protein